MDARLIFAAVFSLCAFPAQAQMYKCVDERGIVSYSDKPRPGCKGGPVNIRADQPHGADKAGQRTEDLRLRDAEFRRRQIERASLERTQKEERDKELASKREYCNALKNDLLTLESRSRIVLDVNSKGDRTYMDDATRARTLAETRENLRTCD